MFNSEISGNVIDLCPVGALTSKPYAFKARPWELRSTETVDLTDSTGSNIYVNFKETEVMRVLPKNNHEINESIITDKARFSYDAVKNQRLQKLFHKADENLSKFQNTNWVDVLSQLDGLLKEDSRQKVTFLINSEIDLESLSLLNAIENKYSSKIQVRTIDEKYKNNYFSWGKNKIKDVKINCKYGFLISSNIRLESAILNTKIRRKIISQTFDVLSLGQHFNSSFPTKFVNLNLNDILKIFEGKSTVSKLFLKSKSPLIFFGESLEKRIKGNFSLISHLRKIIPSAVLLDIKKSANSDGINFSGIKTISKSCIEGSDVCVAINLEDTIFLRKLTKNVKLIWLNPFGSKIATKADMLIPTLSSFESENLYVNLEQRSQKTLKTLPGIGDSRDVKKILTAIYPEIKREKIDKNSKFLNFFEELALNPNKFQSLHNKYSDKDLFTSNYSIEKNLVESYPLKSSLEDFYRSNKFTKNSLTMAQCSQENRKEFNNFKK
jgi:NADH dehydrogenase/NADH:ubiquinone oxidoreductase subunit G